MKLDYRVDLLIRAKHLGINSSQVRFSDKLIWIGDSNGKPVLRQAALDRSSQRVTLYLQAMRSRWGDDDLPQKMLGVLNDCIAELKSKDWNEEDHPRDDDGKFAFGGGGPSEGEGTYGGLVMPSETDPDVVSVGGDRWNKEIAGRLEQEYVAVRADISRSAGRALGTAHEEHQAEENDENAPLIPDSWEVLGGSQQEAAESQYMQDTYQEYLDNEISNWHEDGAYRDALYELSSYLTKGTDDDWALDVLKANYTFKGVDLDPPSSDDSVANKTPLAFSIKELMSAITTDVSDGDKSSGYKPYLQINIDDKVLDAALPTGFESDQQTLPGIKPISASDYLTSKQRGQIREELTNAGADAAQALIDDGKIDPPEYLADSVKESQSEVWGSMDDSEKFNWTEGNTDIIKDAEKEYKDYFDGTKTPELASLDKLPEHFDPLNQTAGEDYKRTQALATFISRDRAAELFVARGIKTFDGKWPFTKAEALAEIRSADTRLWTGWKQSSSGQAGWLLQVATHAELGGRLRENIDAEHTHQGAVDYANSNFKSIGGFEGVKAIIRAKWETTQFLLDKADIQTVDTFRGLKVRPEGQISTSGKVIDFQLARNGAQSATMKPTVAQAFAGSNGTVVRLQVPRTAIISVPAYGINVLTEQEVVVAGTAWKNWDAWKGNDVPTYESVPMEQAA